MSVQPGPRLSQLDQVHGGRRRPWSSALCHSIGKYLPICHRAKEPHHYDKDGESSVESDTTGILRETFGILGSGVGLLHARYRLSHSIRSELE